MLASARIQKTMAGCLAGLMLCGAGLAMTPAVVSPAWADEAGATEATSGATAANSASVASYKDIPDGVMDATLRDQLSLLDCTFEESGLDSSDARWTAPNEFELEEGTIGGAEVESAVLVYESAPTGSEKPLYMSIEVNVGWGDDESEITEGVVTSVADALGIKNPQFTAGTDIGSNFTVTIEGVDLTINVINEKDAVRVEIGHGMGLEWLSTLVTNSWGIDGSQYTSESYAQVRSLIDAGGEAAVAVSDPHPTYAEVTSATSALNTALAQLDPLSAYGQMPYSDVARIPDTYNGVKMFCYGRVLQVSEGFSTNVLRVATSGNYDDVVYVTYDPDMLDYRLLEDDWVLVYGVCGGVYTYTTIFGASITIPSLAATQISLG